MILRTLQMGLAVAVMCSAMTVRAQSGERPDVPPGAGGKILPRFDQWPEAKPGAGGAFEVLPVPQRPLGEDAGPTTSVLGFRLVGVVERAEFNISHASVQAIADRSYQAHVQGVPADPARAQFASEVYQSFAGIVSGEPGAQARMPLGELVAAHPALGGGRAPELYGLNAAELEALDEVLMRAAEQPGQAAGVTIGQTVDLLRRQRHEFTVGQMQTVANAVTAYYRDRGLFLAQAVVPAQTIGEDAIVEIRVIEDTLGQVIVEGQTRYSAKTVARKARRLRGEVISAAALESQLLRTSDYPGLRTFGTFRPGANVGESDLVLQVLEESSWQAEAGLDNYGTELTGEIRGRASGSWNSPLGQGDQLSLSLVQSLSPANNSFGKLGYTMPLGASDYRLGLSASFNDFTLDDGNFSTFNIEGDTSIIRLDGLWQWRRSRFFNAHFGLELVSEKSELGFTGQGIGTINDDQVDKLGLSWGMDRVDSRYGGINVIAVSVESGSRDFLSQLDNSPASEDFSLLNFSYSRLQSLWAGHSALIRLRAQFTGDALSSLEQFSMAGPDAVRAYPVSEVLTDEGLFASLEYRLPGPDRAGPWGRNWRDLLRFDVFVDYAYGSSGNDEIAAATGTSANFSEVLSGLGLGVNFGVPGRLSSQLLISAPLSSRIASDKARAPDAQNPDAGAGEASFGDLRLYGQLAFQF